MDLNRRFGLFFVLQRVLLITLRAILQLWLFMMWVFKIGDPWRTISEVKQDYGVTRKVATRHYTDDDDDDDDDEFAMKWWMYYSDEAPAYERESKWITSSCDYTPWHMYPRLIKKKSNVALYACMMYHPRIQLEYYDFLPMDHWLFTQYNLSKYSPHPYL